MFIENYLKFKPFLNSFFKADGSRLYLISLIPIPKKRQENPSNLNRKVRHKSNNYLCKSVCICGAIP